MKSLLVHAGSLTTLLALATSPASADRTAATTAYGKLLARYVTPHGVNYDTWRSSGSDVKAISEVVMRYRSTDPKSLEPNERKALYINLYNAKILETVLLMNPKGSIRDLSKGSNPLEIFSRNVLSFDQKTISLNDLEKRLREEFKDPRVHFAVNCASRSCPPVRREPYVAARLDAQLDEATREYLASPGAVQVKTEGGRARIVTVKIFDWYADDFEASGGPLTFLRIFGPPSVSEALSHGKPKLDFADYDWGLNASK